MRWAHITRGVDFYERYKEGLRKARQRLRRAEHRKVVLAMLHAVAELLIHLLPLLIGELLLRGLGLEDLVVAEENLAGFLRNATFRLELSTAEKTREAITKVFVASSARLQKKSDLLLY
jgi:hypothetical protein